MRLRKVAEAVKAISSLPGRFASDRGGSKILFIPGCWSIQESAVGQTTWWYRNYHKQLDNNVFFEAHFGKSADYLRAV
jgi:hypothetical protein